MALCNGTDVLKDYSRYKRLEEAAIVFIAKELANFTSSIRGDKLTRQIAISGQSTSLTIL
jgi:hypothetical protein